MATATKKVKAEPQTANGKIQGAIDKLNGLYRTGEFNNYKWYNPQIQFVEGGFKIRWHKGITSAVLKTPEDILTALEKAFVEAEDHIPLMVENLTSYGDTAVVNGNGIKVGCRTVSFAKFDALAEAVAKYRERAEKTKKATTTKEPAKTTAKKTTAKKKPAARKPAKKTEWSPYF